MFDDAKKYVDNGPRKMWDKYFKVYKGQRVQRNYEGVSDPVIRESHTIIETLVANIAGGNPSFHFVKTNEEQSDDTDVLNGMLDYFMICNQMALKNQEWVREMLLYGTGILHITWREGKPFIENIPLRDFFVDPTSTGMVKCTNPARYAGFQYLAHKETLRRTEVFDAKEGKYVPKYKNLDDVGPTPKPNGAADDNSSMDKEFKDLFAGSTLGDKATEEQIHVILLYDLTSGRMVEIGNRKKFIYEDDTPFQREEQKKKVVVEVDGVEIETERTLDEIKPFLPFAVLRDYVDTSQFYGEGEMAVLFGDAELLNDYEAMDVDNNAYQNTPMYQIDPQFADLAPEIETIPGAVYPIPKGAISPIERPQLSGDLDAKKREIAERMRRATAADEAVQGVSQTRSRTTATEVQTQLAQAQNRFSTKISNLESEGYAQLANIIFKLVQIFVTTKQAVRIVGKMGVSFKDYDPWEYNGEWEAHVQLETTIKRRQAEVGMRENQLFEVVSNDPHNIFNPVEVKRWMMQKIDPNLTDEDFNKMLMPPQEEKPKDDTKDFVNVQYKDLEPWAKIQWQKNVGWEVDPQLLGEIQNKMLKQANTAADLMDPATDAENKPVPGMEELLVGGVPMGGGAPAAAPEGMPTPAPSPMPA